jgi:hypothetical protein
MGRAVAMTEEPILPERRKQFRHRAMKPAMIVFDNGKTRVPCLVRDLTDAGARLKVEPDVTVPEAFELEIGHGGGSPRRAHVVWTAERQLGVAFD